MQEEILQQSGMKVKLKPNSNIFGNILWSKEMIEKFIVQNAPDFLGNIIIFLS